MTPDELERIAKFVKAVNAAEREFEVYLELTPGPDKYLRLVPKYPNRILHVKPYPGGSYLELVRPEASE